MCGRVVQWPGLVENRRSRISRDTDRCIERKWAPREADGEVMNEAKKKVIVQRKGQVKANSALANHMTANR